MSSICMYLYLFKHSLKVHASQVASSLILTMIILTTIIAHAVQNFATLQLSLGEGGKKQPNKKKQFNFQPSQVTSTTVCRSLILTSAAGLPQHQLTFPFYSVGNADAQVLLRQGSTK